MDESKAEARTPIDISVTLEHVRHKLLDLTLRNKLLSYKERARSIRIVDELPAPVFHDLVEARRGFQFLPGEEGDSTIDFSPELPSAPAEPDAVAPKHKDRFLQTSRPADQLETRLRQLAAEARRSIEETGCNRSAFLTAHREWHSARTMSTAPHFHLRHTRDRLIDLLGLGETYPLQDVAVSDRLTVPVAVSAKISIDPGQPDVEYELHDRDEAPVPSVSARTGTGVEILLDTPPIVEDVTYKILARKPGREAYLHQETTIRVGLDVGLDARILAPLLDPLTANPSDTDPRMVGHGSQVDIEIVESQEGVDYRLVHFVDAGQGPGRGRGPPATATARPRPPSSARAAHRSLSDRGEPTGSTPPHRVARGRPRGRRSREPGARPGRQAGSPVAAGAGRTPPRG